MPKDYDQESRKNHLLAFKTMTSIISLIQKHLNTRGKPEIRTSDPMDEDDEDRLRLLTALATILVRDNEVTAVAVVRRAPLALMTCAGQSPEEAADSDETFGYFEDDLLTAQNPRDVLEPCDTLIGPHISKPKPTMIPVGDPIQYLLKTWYVLVCFLIFIF
jgi:hypothetical protein